jgi:arylamine N-acetyltransferase
MSAGLQVEKIDKTQDVKAAGKRGRLLSTCSNKAKTGGKEAEIERNLEEQFENEACCSQTQAPASKSLEPRLNCLIKTFQGMQHTLQALTKGFKEMIRNRRWAQKAHARRERRRAARQKEVENQPPVPADCPQTQPIVVDDGIKAEAVSRPPIEDWAPPTELSQGSGWECYDPIGPVAENRETGGQTEAERPRRIEYSHKETQVGEDQKEDQQFFREEANDSAVNPSEKDTKHRDAMRMYRKARKLAYELRDHEKREKPLKDEKRVYRAYITLEDQVGVHPSNTGLGEEKNFRRT